ADVLQPETGRSVDCGPGGRYRALRCHRPVERRGGADAIGPRPVPITYWPTVPSTATWGKDALKTAVCSGHDELQEAQPIIPTNLFLVYPKPGMMYEY